MSRYKTSIETDSKILKMFASQKELCQYDLPKIIGKDYHTALRHLRKLQKSGEIKLTRRERSEKRGKSRKIYSITHKGLSHALYNPSDSIWKKIDNIAEAHKDKILVFKKWNYFKNKNLRDTIIRSCRYAFAVDLQVRVILSTVGPSTFTAKSRYIEQRRQEQEGAIDADILAVDLLGTHQGNPELNTIWKACKEDSELRSFIETYLNSMLNVQKEYLHALEQGMDHWNML